jgi:hypothetical protein
MKLDYFRQKYGINSYILKRLVEDKKVEKVSKFKYKIIDKNFFETFSIEKYKVELHDRHMKKVGEARKAFLAKPENRKELSLIVKTQWEDANTRQKHSESNKSFWKNASEEFLKRHSNNVSNGIKQWYNQMPNEKKVKLLANIAETKRKNGTFNTSKVADACIEWMKQLGFTVECEKPYPGEPNLHCDFYLKELDLWVELHFSHYHNCMPFDKNNWQHQKWLKELKTMNGQYKSIAYTWADLDVRKRENAKRNSLNWIAFYNPEDFDNYFRQKTKENILC